MDETPGLNEALDRFVSAAVGRGVPVTLANHPTAPHCFELNHDSKLSRSIIYQTLAFMRYHLDCEPDQGTLPARPRPPG